jgi:hypothetical protein
LRRYDKDEVWENLQQDKGFNKMRDKWNVKVGTSQYSQFRALESDGILLSGEQYLPAIIDTHLTWNPARPVISTHFDPTFLDSNGVL